MIRRENYLIIFRIMYILSIYIYMEVNFMQTQVKAGEIVREQTSKDILQEANVEINDMLEVKVSDGMIMLVRPSGHKNRRKS